MNTDQIIKAKNLGRCVMPVGSNQKRFAQTMAYIANIRPDDEITEKQSAYLDLMIHRYRKQIPKTHARFCDCDEAQKRRLQPELE